MSVDFWAGYLSGAAGIIIGNPLDIIKVRLQMSSYRPSVTSSSQHKSFISAPRNLFIGTTAPIIGYGGLNALLFLVYNRTLTLLNTNSPETDLNLWTTFLAGATGGLATWVISTPTELVKCKAQASTSQTGTKCWGITKLILNTQGIRGLYLGGVVTALRDSIGYGFYFWTYEITTRLVSNQSDEDGPREKAAKVLLCGGTAGIVSWTSVFPLDVIKTRLQTQVQKCVKPLFPENKSNLRKLSTFRIMRNVYTNEGAQVFFRGLTVCNFRAFLVNATQWTVYEWVKEELGPSPKNLPDRARF